MEKIRKFVMVLICMLPVCCIAQEGGMLNWKFSVKKIAADTFEFTAKAVVAEGWHIYAQDSGEGSMPTKFTFAANPLVKLEGKVIEKGELVKKRNEVMESELKYYGDSVSFVQRVRIPSLSQGTSLPRGARGVVLKGAVEFMVCNESMCLPPEEVGFEVELK